MKKLILSSLLIPCLLLCSAFLHPFYISVCSIEHNPNSRSLEISLKLFTDDLEHALIEAEGTPKLELGSPQEHEKADTYLFRYLQKSLLIDVDGEAKAWIFLGKEVEMDVTWLYLEIPNVEEPRSLKITNRIFVDILVGQQNMVHVKVGDKKKSLLLKKGYTSETLEF